MGRYLNTALRMVIITIILFGFIYPMVITGLAQLFFRHHANGSLIVQHGTVIGSDLIGQSFTRREYFHPRPSAAGNGYDPLQSGGSNLGPTSKALVARVTKDIATETGENKKMNAKSVPVDMVTASASGLDPDISLANAYAQAWHVAQARGATEPAVRQLIRQQTTPRQWGFLGEPRVNVLRINRALDARFGMVKTVVATAR